ncbi:MAG: GAF and ANTAR domain-containing protein [Dermatophilus congolensis]|nr:GAF and ANTAR domain-containing protein [Dermatophilus congolensis]
MSNSFAFANFALQLSAAKDVEESLRLILDTVCNAVGAERGGVMMLVKRHVELAMSSDEMADKADQLQLEYETGPCLEAIEDDSVFIIKDTLAEERWEPWCRAVAEMGVRSVLSIRLATLDGTLGSLNLYSSEVEQFGPAQAALGALLGSHASAALASAKTEAGLREAMQGRHVIGLAQGILMERFGLDEDAAFAVLRRYSQDLNLKLRAVAQEFVETRVLPTMEGPGRSRG